jgi:hypothetical protein
MVDWSSLRSLIATELRAVGLEQAEWRRYGHGRGKEEVLFFKGRGHLVAVPYSLENGVTCYMGREDADPDTYPKWSTLWHILRMDGYDLSDPDQGKAFLAQFPEGPGDMARLIGAKLGELLTP